jgi:2-polyprenyl-3-methyl-5-hydroxy-6-metoxy-1,4-benzoquinol methylase
VGKTERKHHWENVYVTKAEDEVSWFQAEPATSVEFIRHCGAGKNAAIIDVGGGESRLVDRLLDAGYADVTVLDLSAHALAVAKERLGERAASITWIVADITAWTPPRRYRLWHDRAVLHFLTDPEDRRAYLRTLLRAVEPGGCVVISTFALEGPERCSGLPVVRFSAETLAAELGPRLRLVETVSEDHRTPRGISQRFQFSRFTRL